MYQERRWGLRTMRRTTTLDTQSHWLGRRITTAEGKQNSNWGRIWERHHGYREIITARSSCLARAARTNTSDMWLGSHMRTSRYHKDQGVPTVCTQVWFPGLDKMVVVHIQHCHPCQIVTLSQEQKPLLMAHLPGNHGKMWLYLLGSNLHRRVAAGHCVEAVQMGGGRVRQLYQCQSSYPQAQPNLCFTRHTCMRKQWQCILVPQAGFQWFQQVFGFPSWWAPI